jgi:hypothetical protein
MPYFDASIGPFKNGHGRGRDPHPHVQPLRGDVGARPGLPRVPVARDGAGDDDRRDQGDPRVRRREPQGRVDERPADGEATPEMALLTTTWSGRRSGTRRAAGASSRTAGSSSTFRRDPSAPRTRTGMSRTRTWTRTAPSRTSPCLHRLSYTVNPEGDDLGLVERLIDLMRTVNDCWNKLLEWKNRTLMPRRWRRGLELPHERRPRRRRLLPSAGRAAGVAADVPPVPQELFQMLELAVEQMRALAADVNAQPEPDLAAKTRTRRSSRPHYGGRAFLGDYAEFQSRLMRHCLTLVARYYTERAGHPDPRPVRVGAGVSVHRPGSPVAGERPCPTRLDRG